MNITLRPCLIKSFVIIQHLDRYNLINNYVSLLLNIEKLFTSHKKYLFGLLFSGSPKKTHTDQSIPKVFLLSERADSQTFKSLATAKNPFLQCLLLVRLASINYFCSMWQLEDNVFHICLSLPWGSIRPPCSAVWNKWFETRPVY